MKSDIDRWNERFAGREPADAPRPDPVLAACPHLPEGGSALDIASGSGHNAVWLALRGFDVTAIDGSVNGMRLALDLARRCGVTIRPIVADLDRYPLAGRYDVVLVLNFLDRTLYRALPERLVPGGVLIAKAFNRDALADRPDMNPDYVLEPGELPRLFPGLEVLEHAESPAGGESRSHIVCRRTKRPSGPVAS